MSRFDRFAALFRRSRLDREMDEELRAHLDRETEQNVARGLPADEARYAALRAFGGVEQIKERERTVRGVLWLENFARDMGQAYRRLAKSPGFTAVAVLSFAIGIGANTAVFSLVKSVLFRSLPVPEAHALRVVKWRGVDASMATFTGNIDRHGGAAVSGTFPYPTFRDFRQRADGLAEVFALFPLFQLATQAHGQVGVSQGLMVSGNYFAGYGARAHLGRVLTPADDRVEAEPTVVITWRLWEQRFGRDPNALGQTLTINRHPFTIVGVLPRDYTGPLTGDPADVYVPMAAQPRLQPWRSLDSYDNWWVLIMARLAPTSSDAQLQAVLKSAFTHSLEGTRSRMDGPDVLLVSGRGGVIENPRVVRPMLFTLQGIVLVVLLIACANVAGLLLARAAARQREFAICAAIGASRTRLIGRCLAESSLLAVAGAALGLLFSLWFRSGLLRFVPQPGFKLHLDVGLDHRVLAFTLAVSLATGLLSGLLPAWRASRVDPALDLQGGRTGDPARQRLGRVLVATQVALSILLLTASGLFVRTVGNLRGVDPGFNPENLLLFHLHADRAVYGDQQRVTFFDNVRDKVARLPGVKGAVVSNILLVGGSMSTRGFSIPGRDRRPDETWNAHVMDVGEGYLQTMRIRLIAGREFVATDAQESQRVVIVNELFARNHFPGEDPIDRIVRVGDAEYRVIGVCGSTLYNEVKGGRPATMYLSARQQAPESLYVAARTAVPPLSLVPAVRRAVAEIDPLVPLADISTQAELFDRSLFVERLFLALSASLAGFALLLSCLGLYGLMAYNVARRRVEIGVRMALGAPPVTVARAILREGVVMTAWGLVVGLPLAVGLAFLARQAFFGVAPYDPATIAAAVALLLCVTVLAAWLPARRATRIDPMVALRAE